MKTSNFLFVTALLLTNCLFAQKSNINSYLTLKPATIKSVKSGIQEYAVTLKWQNLDAINGTKFNCNAVKATYSTGLKNDSVRWKDVSLAQITDFQQKDYKGTALPSFDGFTYQVNETNFLADDFYKSIPLEHRDLAKWLVSDAIQMQGLAWYVFDSLEFNKPYVPKFLSNYDIKFQDWVTFTSRYQKLIWTGITQCNNEVCAVVKFESLYNPLKIENEQMTVKGRSLYYGELWISLIDKQVEHAWMLEDVVMKITSPAFAQEQLIDLQRDVVFTKVQ